MCVLSIKEPIRKMPGNLFHDPRIWFQLTFAVPTDHGKTERKRKVR